MRVRGACAGGRLSNAGLLGPRYWALVIGPSGSCIGQDSRGWSAAYQPEPHKTSRIHVLLGLDPLGYMY
jgi:hypothetical protein